MNLERANIKITDICEHIYFFDNVSFDTNVNQTILYIYNKDNKRCAFFMLNNIVAIEILKTCK